MPVRSSGTPDIRSVINSKQRKTFSKGRAGMASSREGELFTTMEGGRAYINFKKHGRLWKTPMSFDGNVYVDKNLYVEGTLRINNKTQFNNPVQIGNAATNQQLNINGTAITATPAELNKLDGVTATTAELNLIDGVTATTAELNIMDGVTQTTAQLNYVSTALVSGGIKDGATLGDGIENQMIFSDQTLAGGSAGNTPSASTIWTETSTSYVLKAALQYYHQRENKSLICRPLLRSTDTASCKIAAYNMSAGVGAADNDGGSAVGSDEGTTTSGTFTPVKVDVDVTGLTDDTLYRIEVSLKTSAGTSYMTGLNITGFGS